MPSLSTIAPVGSEEFLNQMIDIKNKYYGGGQFQFQFSIHSTDAQVRDAMIPVKKLSFDQMADFGERYYEVGDRKVTLNFALAQDIPVDAEMLRSYFDPQLFLVKITPLNPTYRARDNNLKSYIDTDDDEAQYKIVNDLEDVGFQVIVSIGALEENYIGSNCGQYVRRHLEQRHDLEAGYTYPIVEHGSM
jgi:23S rRNA (adenine2503-C2)-methyltransferase